MNKNFVEFNLVENHFSGIYLTIIALIQGIALSSLSGSFVEAVETEDIYWERYILMLMVIFLVWHHYMYGVIYLKWFPGISDTLLPLALGVTQFIMASMINDSEPHHWLLSSSLFFIVGGAAYINAAIRTKPELFSSHYKEGMALTYSRFIGICHGSAAVGCVAQAALIAAITYDIIRYEYIVGSIILVCLHIALYEYYYLKKIKPHFLEMLCSDTT